MVSLLPYLERNTTGIFTDNTHTYTAPASDAMNYQIVTGSTGTSISISLIEVYGNATPTAASTGVLLANK